MSGEVLLVAGLVGGALLVLPGRGRPVRGRLARRGARRPTNPGGPARRRGSRLDDAQLLGLADLLAGQLRAGADARPAWAAALELLGREADWPDAPADDDPVRWLRRHGPSGPATTAVCAAWRLSEQTGAPLSGVLAGVARSLRAAAELAVEVEAARAGPLATVRLLTVLPLGGLALGELIGARSVDALVGTAPGRLCGVLGLTLLGVGRCWMGRMVRSVGAVW